MPPRILVRPSWPTRTMTDGVAGQGIAQRPQKVGSEMENLGAKSILVVAALLLAGLGFAPSGHADDCFMDPDSFDCGFGSSNSGFGGAQDHGWMDPARRSGDPGGRWSACGGGRTGTARAPVVSAGGGMPVIPAAPPIG